jgi:hypothetical protein
MGRFSRMIHARDHFRVSEPVPSEVDDATVIYIDTYANAGRLRIIVNGQTVAQGEY